MKSITKILLVLSVLLIGFSANSQIKTTIPLHPDVKHGVLENGMNYYILHNEEPKERASFYFVQNVGAILENDSQNGLAHFLEHMSFNGTQHFEGKGIIHFLEQHGVRFGNDINAYTAQDQTVYNLSNIPINAGEGLLDSCLLVLHDWSGYLLLKNEEIEAERGVIHEEWRTRRNSQFRLQSQTSKVLFKDSKYAIRDVIGDLDVIDNFEYETLREYYKTWYRPDQQAVVVVGDIDVQVIEAKVKELFSPIPLRENLPEREYFSIPDNDELLFCKATDPEAQFMAIILFYKNAAPKIKNEKTNRDDIIKTLYSQMINTRFQELSQNPESNSLMAMTVFMPMTRQTNAFALQAVPKEGKGKESFEELLTGVERVKRDGFEQAELDRVKLQLESQVENSYQNRNEITHDAWATQLGNHFLQGEPVIDPKDRYELSMKTLKSITLNEVNEMAKTLQSENNQVLIVQGPEKDGMVFPTQEELEGVIAKVQSSKIEKYEDNVGSQPLISDELKGSEVVEEFSLPGIDAKGFVLGNGAKVVMMPTEHSDDEIIFSAFSFGGTSLLPDEDLYSANITTSIAQQSGLGEFDMIQLQKKLSGKMAMVNPSLSELTEGLSGSSNIKDIETLLQLCYMRFESPRFDKKAYQVFVNQMETIMSNLKADNNRAMQDTVALVSSNHSPRTITLNDDFLKNINFNKIEEIYKQRFHNASDFTFVLVGNVDIERDLPLVKKYIGSIGTENTSEAYVDHDMGPADGESRVHFEREMEVAKTTIFTSFSGDMKFSRKNQLCVSAIGKLLDKRYMETIREEEGGSYGVSVGASLGRLPEPEYTMVVRFDTDPEKKDRLLEIVHQEMNKLSKDGADSQDLEEVKKAIIKVRKEQLDKNGFWLGAIRTSLMYEEDFLSMDEYEALVNSITEKDIKKIAKKMFSKPDLVEVIMNPKK